MPTALITGATSGIGAEFASQLAAARYDLVLVARNAERLDATAAELRRVFGIRVEVLAADLETSTGRAVAEERAKASGEEAGVPAIDYLVNNAGSGLRKSFELTDADDEQRHLDLLVTAPMRLMHAALEQMVARRTGTIVNIASVAGFTPRGSYGAAKAWVLSFSRWAHIYYAPLGVQVAAVAPGFVRTDFHRRMAVRTDTVPDFMWLDAAVLVRIALRDVARGRGLSVPTLRYKVVVGLSRVLPGRVLAAGSLHPR